MIREPLQRVDIVTVFPQMVREAAGHSILGRAQTSGVLSVNVHDLREWTTDKHRSTDDMPFGGGAGMVMKPEPLFACVEAVLADAPDVPVLLTAPDGEPFTQRMAEEMSAWPRWVVLCGHYEGVDERVREGLVTREVSLGDYVLTGGELAALVLLDAVARLLPGVLGNADSVRDETFGGDGLLEYPHYTRPSVFRGAGVPDVLLSGHHANIVKWRRTQSLVRTRTRRPDIWKSVQPLAKADRKLLDAYDSVANDVVGRTGVSVIGDTPEQSGTSDAAQAESTTNTTSRAGS